MLTKTVESIVQVSAVDIPKMAKLASPVPVCLKITNRTSHSIGPLQLSVASLAPPTASKGELELLCSMLHAALSWHIRQALEGLACFLDFVFVNPAVQHVSLEGFKCVFRYERTQLSLFKDDLW